MALNVATPSGITPLQSWTLANGNVIQGIYAAPAPQTAVGPPEYLSVGVSAVVSLTPPAGATHALLWVEANDIRKYSDGTAPTTGATGHGVLVAAGSTIELDMANFANFKMIGKTGTAIVQVEYWKYG